MPTASVQADGCERETQSKRDVKRGGPQSGFSSERLKKPESAADVGPQRWSAEVAQDATRQQGDDEREQQGHQDRYTKRDGAAYAAVSRISRKRAGRIAPSCCHDAAMNPPSPSSVGATQLLKSSASGAPRQTSGVAIATNATLATQRTARRRSERCLRFPSRRRPP